MAEVASPGDQLVHFKKKATTACKNKNAQQFSKLFCETSKANVMKSSYFSRSDVSFNTIKIEPSDPDIFQGLDYQYLLMICYEPHNSKEMCELYPVVEVNDQFCIKKISIGK